MLKHLPKWTCSNSLLFPPQPTTAVSRSPSVHTSHGGGATCIPPTSTPLKIQAFSRTTCRARRRVRYNEDDDDDDEEDEYGGGYKYNEEIAVLEAYTQLMKDEILLVQAIVDQEQLELLIFKGFSSCLSSKTSSDPSRSVVPAKAVIKSIDRARGPFDPSNIQYIDKGLTFDSFKIRLLS